MTAARTRLSAVLALLGAGANPEPSSTPSPSSEGGRTLECRSCGRTVTREADAEIEDPLTGERFGVVDSVGPCPGCGDQWWRYVR